MIRRVPPTPAQRRRRVICAITVAVVIAVAVVGPTAPRATVRAGPPAQLRPPATISRLFHATGGPVTAVVSEKGSPTCEVDLLAGNGGVLARGWAGSQAVTLRTTAVADVPLSLVLHPPRGVTLSWQAELTGATG